MTANKALTSYLTLNRSYYDAVLDRYVAVAREENPALSIPNEEAIREHFAQVLAKGGRDSIHTAQRMAKMDAKEIAEYSQYTPDKLSETSRQIFAQAAEKRRPEMRWEKLFPDGIDNLYLPLSSTSQSMENKIDAYLQEYNQQAEINYQNAKAAEDVLVAEGKLNAKWRKAGRANQPGQRQLRRDPSDPAKLQSFNRTPKPGKDPWEAGQRLGAFLEAQYEWRLINEFEVENSRKASNTSSERGASDKGLSDASEILWDSNEPADYYDPETLMVVISRDPQKIGEMSSGQHWRSCMSENGGNFHYVPHDIEQGSLVAYVTSKQDPDARYPLMRQLLKPFRNEQGETILVPAIIYGGSEANNSYTRNALQDTLSTFVKERVNHGASGTFTMAPELYRDGQAATIFLKEMQNSEEINTALKDFYYGALQERVFEHDTAYKEADIARFDKQIRSLWNPEQLARQFYREMNKVTIGGTIPKPEDILSLLPTEQNKDAFYEGLLLERKEEKSETIMQAYTFYKDKPYAQRILNEITDFEPSAAFEHFNVFYDEPFAEEIITKAAALDPGAAIKGINQYKDQPYAEAIFRKAVEADPEEAVANIYQYKDQPYAEEIFTKAVEDFPEKALSAASYYTDEAYAEKIIRAAAAKASAKTILNESYSYRKETYGEEIICKAAKEDPYEALQSIHKYKDQPYAQKIVMEATDIYPAFILDQMHYLKEQPFMEELLLKAAEKSPVSTLYHIDDYKNLACAGDIISKATERGPDAALECANRYREEPYAEAVIRSAAEKDPVAALEHASRYKDLPYAEELIRKAASIEAFEALEYAPNYIDKPYAEAVIRQAAEEHPSGALRNAMGYKDEEYGEEVIRKAAMKEPYKAFANVNNYHDQPYVHDMLLSVAVHEPEATLKWYEENQDREFLLDDWADQKWIDQFEDIAKQEMETRKKIGLTSRTSLTFNQDYHPAAWQQPAMTQNEAHVNHAYRIYSETYADGSVMEGPYHNHKRDGLWLTHQAGESKPVIYEEGVVAEEKTKATIDFMNNMDSVTGASDRTQEKRLIDQLNVMAKKSGLAAGF